MQILNIKRPRRDGGLIDNTALLTDGDLRITAGDTVHFRRVALQIWRQHTLIAGEVDPGEAHRIKNLRIQIDFADRQFCSLHR